jgi:hypothetical protein
MNTLTFVGAGRERKSAAAHVREPFGTRAADLAALGGPSPFLLGFL